MRNTKQKLLKLCGLTLIIVSFLIVTVIGVASPAQAYDLRKTPPFSSYTNTSGRYLGDFNGDGYTELAIISGNTLYTYKGDYHRTFIASLTLSNQFAGIYIGRFLGNGREQIVITDWADRISTYQLEGSYIVCMGSCIIVDSHKNYNHVVGNFDSNDSTDEIMTIDPIKGEYGFTRIDSTGQLLSINSTIDRGNLPTYLPVSDYQYVLAGDFYGYGGIDQLLIVNGQKISRYNTYHTSTSILFSKEFTITYDSTNTLTGITVARINDGNTDNLAVMNKAPNGDLSLRLYFADTDNLSNLRPITMVTLGNLSGYNFGNTTPPAIAWGSFHGVVSEPGNKTRQDILIFNKNTNMCSRYDARAADSYPSLTYWWVYNRGY